MTLSAGCYLLGYLTGLAAFALMARRRGLATAGVMATAGAGLIGGLAGADLAQAACFAASRLFHALPGETLGKTVLGGVAGGYLAVILYKRRLGLRRPTGDLFAVAVPAGEAVGRWGCFYGGCCYGTPSHVPWAVFQHGEMRHPAQLYLAAANALIVIILLGVERTRPPENTLFYLQGALYCAARFGVEFFRAGPPPVAGLSLAQWACLVGFAFFGAKLARPRPPRPNPGGPASEEEGGETPPLRLLSSGSPKLGRGDLP